MNRQVLSRFGVVALVGVLWHVVAMAAEPPKPWSESVQVTLGPPVVVAQAEEAKLPWGIWQFATLSEPEPGTILLAFNMNEDRPHASVAELKLPGRFVSVDGGKSWQPTEREEGFTSLYSPTELCHRRNGEVLYLAGVPEREIPLAKLPTPVGVYNTTYTLRDRREVDAALLPQSLLFHKAASDTVWQKTPVTIDDPDRAVISYDPPGKDYAIVRSYRAGRVLELADGSLLAIGIGLRLGADRKPLPKWRTDCLRSTDEGRTWKFQSVVAGDDDDRTVNGYSEPGATLLPDGSILVALRTERGAEANQTTGVLFLTRSCDHGQTWSEPRAVNPFGVFPRLLTLENGVTALSFGRPGVNLLFNTDGQGHHWESLTLLVNEGQRFVRTSGYTSLIPTGPDRFLMAYDQFDYPNAQGQPRKTILVREIVVR